MTLGSAFMTCQPLLSRNADSRCRHCLQMPVDEASNNASAANDRKVRTADLWLDYPTLAFGPGLCRRCAFCRVMQLQPGRSAW
jgi:hypothetical protein